MRFAYPFALWLLLLLPGLLFLVRQGKRRRTAFLRRFGDPALLCQTPKPVAGQGYGAVTTVLCVLPFLCIILALGDPRLPQGAPRLRPGALDVVMVFDVSKSMAAEDYGPRSRLAQARDIARHLLAQLHGNRVGLITFAGSSFRQADLTEDLSALDFILQYWVGIDATRVGGSDIAQALATGLTLFNGTPERHRLLLVFSDGGDTSQALTTVLSKATQHGVRIVALGLGRPEPSRIPLYDAQRAFQGYMQDQGRVLTTRLNEAPLQQMASTTGGSYYRLTRGDEWHPLLTQPAVVGTALEREEVKIFQLFLACGLVIYGVYQYRARRY